jgi:hypothetical protein
MDPIPLVHTVTPIGAARILLPYLNDFSLEAVYAHLWHVSAAIICGFTPASLGWKAETSDPEKVLSPAELMDRAVEHGDPHVLKFTEVCISENCARSEPVYLAAAAHVLDKAKPL